MDICWLRLLVLADALLISFDGQNGSNGSAAKATIDEVSEASPAAAAGLRVGDQVCRFGAVSMQDDDFGRRQGGYGRMGM
jgi:S1-C subfamily serine protease